MAKITLQWTASTGPVVGYKIYRDLNTFNQSDLSYLTPIADVASTSYEDTTIIIEDEYYYYGVSAYDASGTEVLSKVIQVAMIGAPKDLTAVYSSN